MPCSDPVWIAPTPEPIPTTAELVERYQSGDKDAGPAIYWRLKKLVITVARRKLGRWTDVEHAAQETWLEFFAKLDKAGDDPIKDAGAFLRTAAERNAIDQVRKRLGESAYQEQ